VPVTFTLKVQVRGAADVPIAIEPLVSVTDVDVVPTVPGVQVVLVPPAVARPEGKLSVTENAEMAAPEIFRTVTTKRLVPPGAMVEGVKVLLTEAPLVTVNVAVADAWVTPPIEPAVTLFT
jgi:hypothetical protein